MSENLERIRQLKELQLAKLYNIKEIGFLSAEERAFHDVIHTIMQYLPHGRMTMEGVNLDAIYDYPSKLRAALHERQYYDELCSRERHERSMLMFQQELEEVASDE
jgi:hypothetical protein